MSDEFADVDLFPDDVNRTVAAAARREQRKRALSAAVGYTVTVAIGMAIIWLLAVVCYVAWAAAVG